MHALKNHSSHNNEERVVNQVKKSPIKAADGNSNLLGMVIKNSKSKINSSGSNIKSHSTTSEVKSLLNFKFVSPTTQTSVINFDKRKNDKSDVVQKKSKTETTTFQKTDISDDLVLAKKINKFKSIYPKTYVCKFCCRRFYSEEYLQQHSKSHGNKTSHICYLCNHQTASFSALMTHYLKHSGTKGNKLEKIYAKSKADYTNIQFNISSRPKPSFQCSKCKLSFNTKSKCDSHNCSAVLEKRVYNCAYCGRASSTIEEYRNCVQSHTETPFICTYCKSKFQRMKQLYKHLEQCKPRSKVSEDYKCDRCVVFVCKSKKEFDEHLKSCKESHLKSCEESYMCTKCKSNFVEKKTYEDHLLVCKPLKKEKSSVKKVGRPKKPLELLKKKKFPCGVCGHIFNLKKECKEHEQHCVIKTPNVTDETNFDECSTCGSVIEISKLFEHINTCSEKHDLNTQKKSVNTVDEEGDLQNNSKSNLDSVYIDNDKDKNSVSIDNKTSLDQNEINIQNNSAVDDSHATRRSARLVRRKSSFSEDNDVVKKKRKSLKIKIKNPKIMIKPKYRKGKKSKNSTFLCNICDFSFCSKSTLLRHKRMHSGNPWYICQYCGKFFFRKDVYIRHEGNVHSKETNTIFRCCYCKVCFDDSSLLKDHVLAEHKDSAFLPIRRRFSGKKCPSSTEEIQIKQESDNEEMDNMVDLINSKEGANKAPNENVYPFPNTSNKCDEFSQSLEVSSDTAVHMDTHSNDSENKNTNDFHNISEIEEMELSIQEPMSFNSKMSDNKLFCESTVSVSHEPKAAANSLSILNNDIENCTKVNSAPSDLMPNTNFPISDQSKALVCMMCFKEFSSESLLEAHNKTTHKIVDWYQCLVCLASGPKQDMQEHMFSHMFKVGTFVVNSESRNFDTILSCLQLGDQENLNYKNTDICKEQETVKNNLSSDMSDLACNELPPLREFGICPCINKICKQDQNKMPDLQNEADLDNECNSSLNLEAEDFSSFTSDADEINSKVKSSTECQSGVIKYRKNNDLNAISTDICVEPNNVLDEKEAKLDYSEFESSNSKMCTDNSIATHTSSYMQYNDALEEEEAKLKNSPNCKTNVSKLCTDSNSRTNRGKKFNDALEEKETKLKYSSEHKTSVMKCCTDSNFVVINTDTCIKSGDAVEEIEAELKYPSECKTNVVESCTDSNSTVVRANTCIKFSDALEDRESNLNYSSECKTNVTDCCTDSNFIAINTDTCIKSRDTLEERGVKGKRSSGCKTSVVKSWTDNNSIDVSTSTSMKSNDSLKRKKTKLKYASQCKTSSSKCCTDGNFTDINTNTCIKSTDTLEGKLKYSSKCKTNDLRSWIGRDSIASSTDTSMKSNNTVEEKEAKLKYSPECKISVIKSWADNNYIALSTDEYNDTIEKEETKLKYSSECKPNVIKSCDSIAISADTCVKSSDSVKEEVANLKFTSECKTSVTKSCTKSNYIAVTTDTYVKSNDTLEVREKKVKCFNECRPNATLSCTNSSSSFSSQAKEHFLSIPSDECVSQSDYEIGNFSQLRSLLLKPSKKSDSYENKITIYPSSHPEVTGFSQESSNPFIKCVSNIEEYNAFLPNQQNQNLSDASGNKCNFDVPKQNFNAFNNNLNFTVQAMPDSNHQSTCLKFDVKQSRSQLSDNIVASTLNQKLPNCVYNKTDNLFKPFPSQSTILDFSDLIQHSFENSGPCEDNIFSYSNSMKQVDFLSDVSSREEVRTPDCTNMVNYDCSTFNNSAKCDNCNVIFEDDNEYTNHKCLCDKPLKFAEINSLYKPKNSFQSVNYIENQNKVPCVTSTSEDKLNILSTHKSSETFVQSKVTSPQRDFERYRKSETSLNVHSASESSKCNRCHKTFRNLSELMKHSLTCLKPLFFPTSPIKKTSATNDCVTPAGTSSMLHLRDEPNMSFSDFSLNPSVSANTVCIEHPLNSEDLIKHAFDS